MKKSTVLKVLLILFPVLAIGLATTMDSVTVMNTLNGNVLHGSYFSLLPVGAMQLFAPLAGIGSIVILVLSVLSIIMKNGRLILWIKWLAFTACCAAVVPVVLRGEVLVVPNVGVPIFMAGEWLTAYLLKAQPKAEVKGERLSRH